MFDGRIISGITVFVAVAEAGSYARASEQVGLSRSGVSKAIVRLEHRTGMRLFDRTSRVLKLTAEGRLFLEGIKPLLDRLAAAASPSGPQEIKGHLRISCDAAFGVYLLMPAIDPLLKRYPSLKVDLLVRDRVDNLLADGFDAGVRFGESDFRGLKRRLLFQSRIVTCASPAYVDRHGLPAEPDDLHRRHRCITLLSDWTGKSLVWRFLNERGESREFVPECSLTVNDAPLLMAGMQAGAGIVRALDFMVEGEIAAGRLVEVLPAWNCRRWPAYLYVPDRVHLSPVLDAFSTFIVAAFERP